MSLSFRERERHRTAEPQANAPQFGTSSSATDSRNVLVSSGIHRGRFPIGGMSVRQARRVLAPLINIDATAVAVINGRAVDEETMLDGQIGMLSFVKPSSLKG
jgi:hypothetical protein